MLVKKAGPTIQEPRFVVLVPRDVLDDEHAISSSELTATYVASAEGLGVTRDAAVRDAAANLAPDLANGLLSSLGGDTPQSMFTVTVTDVQRPSTRFEIQDQLIAAQGTELIGSIEWDEELKVLNFRVSSGKSACDAAANIADSRRVLLNVDSCQAGRIVLRAVRE